MRPQVDSELSSIIETPGGQEYHLARVMPGAGPIVFSHVIAHRFLASDATGYGARLVALGNVEGLVKAIEGIATAPEIRAEMSDAKPKRVRQFGWDHLLSQVRHQYVAALASRGRTADGAVDSTAAAV